MVNGLLEGNEVECCYGGDAKLCRGEGATGRGRGGSTLGRGWEHPQDGGDALSLQGQKVFSIILCKHFQLINNFKKFFWGRLGVTVS